MYTQDKKIIHSLVEININDTLYYLDVLNANYELVGKNLIFGKYLISKKGRDSWNIGLKNYNDLIHFT
mgnify:FL=1